MAHKIVIVGGGKIGYSIAKLLAARPASLLNGTVSMTDFGKIPTPVEYVVTLVDSNANLVEFLKKDLAEKHPMLVVDMKVVDVNNEVEMAELFKDKDSVLSACPYTANVAIATAALKAGISYFDLTEDRYTTDAIEELSKNSVEGQIFMPQCGLAPGFIGILANHVYSQLDSVDELKMRVGALPLYPSNRLKYNLTWSTEGLINEYANDCEAIVNFKKVDTIPLEEVETFSMQGVEYEAFNTSGGLGTLCDTLNGKVKNMNYKTLRYPGHVELMKFLIKDLNLGVKGPNRDMLKKVFDDVIPTTPQDVVIAFCTAKGKKDGKLLEFTNLFKVPHQEILGENWTAIQVTTASGACAAIDAHARKTLPTKGFVKQEDMRLTDLLDGRFGRWYKGGIV